MRLKSIKIHKYKSFSKEQNFDVEHDVTILVGMNESGKTSALEAAAKAHYFQEDEDFVFTLTHDFPRKEKKKVDKSAITPSAVTCTYVLDEDLLHEIESELGQNVVTFKSFSVTTDYKNEPSWSVSGIHPKNLISNRTEQLGISSNTLNQRLERAKNLEDLSEIKSEYTEEKYIDGITSLEKYYQNEWGWKDDPLGEYIVRTYLAPNRPKFLYYDEYFSLPSRISIEKLQANELDENEYKTAKALFELADINIEEIIKAENFEDFIAELEATEAIISEELFKYWKTNKGIQITFQIDKIEKLDHRNNNRIVEHILDVRVKSKGVSLPLKNRSKGFNWFFSFLVWFKKIQEDSSANYILLLDEPGLNLHASAQSDLLKFIEDLSKDYQIIYTTHSPFMIAPDKLNRVRTVLETSDSSIISESIQEKDPNTLFPLQAALGYDIAQNLFISKRNLLVEGVSDLIILTSISGVLESLNRTHLRADVTIVPTGGLEKVATFISLLRGSQLEIVCLLDSYTDLKGKEKMESLVREKIVHKNKVRFYHEYIDSYGHADLEDLFVKQDYLNLFNAAFPEHRDIFESNLDSGIRQIVKQINQYLGVPRFNHYRPANQLTKIGTDPKLLTAETLDNFEKVFIDVNKLFGS